MKVFFPHTLPFIISISFICVVAWGGGVLISRLWGEGNKQDELITLQEAGSFLIKGVFALTALGSMASFL